MNPHPIDSKLYYLFEKIKYEVENIKLNCANSIRKFPITDQGIDLHALIHTLGNNKIAIQYVDTYLRCNPEKINIQDRNGKTLIMKSLYHNKLMKVLLKYNHDLYIKDNDGNIFTSFLTDMIDYNIIKTVIRSKPEIINIQDINGKTILYHYIEDHKYKFVKLIMKYHPNIDLKTKKNMDAITIALLNHDAIDYILPTRKIFLKKIIHQPILKTVQFYKINQCDFKIIYKTCKKFKHVLKFL